MPTITATTPELWTTLIEICNQLGIATSTLPALTTPQEIIEFMHTLNIDLQPLYREVTTLEQTGWTWVYNAPVNPAETTDMVVRGITDLTVVGGGATGITQGKKIFGTISKKIAAMAMVAALGISTFAAQIGEHITELAEGLKPWTVDGDDAVPVMIDENGITYLDERAINKFRSDLKDLGVFDSLFVPDTEVKVINTTVTVPNLKIKDVFNTEIRNMVIRMGASKNISANVINSCMDTIWNIINGSDYTFFTSGHILNPDFTTFLNTPVGGFTVSFDSSTPNSDCYIANGKGAVYLLKNGNYVLDKEVVYHNVNTLTQNNRTDLGVFFNKVGTPNSYENRAFIKKDTRNDSRDVNLWPVVPGVSSNYAKIIEFHIMASGTGTKDSVVLSIPFDYIEWNSGTGSGNSTITQNIEYGYHTVSTYYAKNFFTYYHDRLACDVGYLFNGTMGEGVPGFVPTNPTVGDLTKSITEIYPDWTSNGVTLPSPKEEDLTNTADWLPVSINDTDIQDHTATSDDQDGDTSEDAQQSIMEKLMELIQTLTQEQAGTGDEVITPTIPVGDSGDTPPATPTVISGASNGLWTIYNPTLSEVQQFGAWLWSDSIIDQIKRQFASPIDGVIGFMSIYCTPITGDRKMIKTGYLTSPVSAKEVTNQYVTINCGQVAVPEYYHSAIDYTRSKVDIFLPFIGIVPLDCSVVTGSTLEVIYRIDVLTGTCLAQIKVIKQNSDAVMYTYNGNCGVQLPLTAGTYTGLIGTLASLCSGAISAMSGNMIGVGESLMGMAHSMGTNIQKSGVLASNAGALGIRIPYLIITHPTAYDAMIYNQFYGYPSNVYQRLSAMSGFVRVKDIHLDSISCTDQELEMIYAKLKEGVIIS